MNTEADIILPDILPPSDDGVFKALLTHKDAALILKDLLASTLALPVAEATILNTELPISDINEKRERFDVCCKLDDGKQVDVEMQSDPMQGDSLKKDHPNIKARSVYNLCDLHSSQQGKGIDYSYLAQSFQVMFCGYSVFSDSQDFVRRFYFRDENAKLLNDSVGIVFVELSKLDNIVKRPVEEMSSLEMWSIFFAHASEDRYKELLTEMVKTKKEIEMATKLLANISKDEIERAHFRSRRKWQMDMDHNFAASRNEGRAEGLAEGLVKGREEGQQLERLENARRMKTDGMDTSLIARYSGLSPGEVEDL